MSDGLAPSLPHANNESSSVQNKLYRKLLTAKRLLVVNLKQWAKGNDLDNLATEFPEIKKFLRITKLALMITYATPRLKRNYLGMWKTCFIRCLRLHDGTIE